MFEQTEQVTWEGRAERVEKQEGSEEGNGGNEQPTQERQEGSNDIPVAEIQQEVSEPIEQTGITGNIVRAFSNIGKGITGFVITAFDIEGGESGGSSDGGESSGGESSPATSEPASGQPAGEDGEFEQNPEGQMEEPGQAGEQPQYNEEDNRQRMEDESQRRSEQMNVENEKRRNEGCSKMCHDNCERNVIVPCVQKCIFDSKCGVSCDNEMESCKGKCKEEKDISQCTNECKDSCMKGEGFEMQQSEENNKFEKAVFTAGGMCRVSDEKKEAGMWFDGWGEPFEGIRYLKQEYYNEGNDEWCRNELNNYLKQREEFENGMNREFLIWFFQDYIANSANEWEDHISGIFELYWKDVELTKEIARTSGCSETGNIPEFNLVNVKYESEYGKVEFWEEMKSVSNSEFGGKGDKEINVVTPYMKIWVFQSREFIEYEMADAMKKHEFPGSEKDKTERKNKEGLTETEKEQIKQNKELMNTIKAIADKYGGNANVAVQFIDYNTSKIVFNLYVKVNENDVVKMEPMLPEEMPKENIKIEINFDEIYKFIYEGEKSMRGERVESPPWDRKFSPVAKVKEITNGIKMYFKMKSLINSATITPSDSEKDVRKLLNKFMNMMMNEGGDNQEQGQGERGQDNGQGSQGQD